VQVIFFVTEQGESARPKAHAREKHEWGWG